MSGVTDQTLFNYYYGPNICVSQNLYVEILTPSVMTYRDRAFGSSLGLDKVKQVGP